MNDTMKFFNGHVECRITKEMTPTIVTRYYVDNKLVFAEHGFETMGEAVGESISIINDINKEENKKRE